MTSTTEPDELSFPKIQPEAVGRHPNTKQSWYPKHFLDQGGNFFRRAWVTSAYWWSASAKNKGLGIRYCRGKRSRGYGIVVLRWDPVKDELLPWNIHPVWNPPSLLECVQRGMNAVTIDGYHDTKRSFKALLKNSMVNTQQCQRWHSYKKKAMKVTCLRSTALKCHQEWMWSNTLSSSTF